MTTLQSITKKAEEYKASLSPEDRNLLDENIEIQLILNADVCFFEPITEKEKNAILKKMLKEKYRKMRGCGGVLE